MRPRRGQAIRRAAPLAQLAAVVLILFAGIAGAHRASYSTAIIEETASPSPGPDFKVTGHLESPKGACIPNRIVKFLARSEDGTKVVLDKDRTNDRGRWVLIGDLTSTHDERIKASEKRLRKRHGHRRVCEAASIPLLF